MVSHRDERDSFDAFNTHSQACLLHLLVSPFESGSLTSGSDAAFSTEKPAPRGIVVARCANPLLPILHAIRSNSIVPSEMALAERKEEFAS